MPYMYVISDSSLCIYVFSSITEYVPLLILTLVFLFCMPVAKTMFYRNYCTHNVYFKRENAQINLLMVILVRQLYQYFFLQHKSMFSKMCWLWNNNTICKKKRFKLFAWFSVLPPIRWHLSEEDIYQRYRISFAEEDETVLYQLVDENYETDLTFWKW